jgi:AraC-like DNA-binding protein
MNQLLLWNDVTLLWGSNARPISGHKHPVVQLVVAIKDSFLSKDENGNWVKKRGLLIAPNQLHECDAKNVQILSLDIDPESSLGEWIMENYLLEQKVMDVPSSTFPKLDFNEWSNKLKYEKWKELRSMVDKIFMFQKTSDALMKDDRVEKILMYISNNIETLIDTKTLMEIAHLSESRMLHLFKEEMGLPIRNYILWFRLKTVLAQILNGESLTEAAYSAGFSDQAHMTRTCVKMFGIPPSQIIKNSKFIQVSFQE